MTMTTRIHNFNAGPAVLPVPVLEQAQAELLNYAGSGMSVMEMTHRSKAFEAIVDETLARLRSLMGITDEYSVLLLQGGASLQFAMVPMNLRQPGQVIDVVDTGSWATKALKEAKIGGPVNIAWSGKEDQYMRMPRPEELAFTPDAAYVHVCSNETIEGIQYVDYPQTPTPLVADMSSDILSRVIDVNRFGVIFAGAQKNIGPSGIVVVIMRNDLLERTAETVPLFLRYATHAKEKSLYNTPNTWGIYLMRNVLQWIEAEGGVAAIERRNAAKAQLIYDELDASAFWQPCARRECRSTMNVTWRLSSEALEEQFVKEAKANGLEGLKGHRSVGGIRASIYNACPMAAVEALVSFMREFQRTRG